MTPSASTIFAYPDSPHVRRHGPSGYTDYGSYKPWLRDEFSFRCVYCLFRERWFPREGPNAFSIDHVRPRSAAPHLACEYTNLLYACQDCNSARQDQEVPDPCVVGLGGLVRLAGDGSLIALAPLGHVLIEALGLNLPKIKEGRLAVLALLARLLRARKDRGRDLARWFGYPDDLPDLSVLRPPDGNERAEGVEASAFARRSRRELPATY